MEYPPAFRLQDKTTGKHDLRHMTKHEHFFKRVWYGNTGSTQNWLNSVFYSIKEIETKKSKSYNCGKLRELFFDRQDKTRLTRAGSHAISWVNSSRIPASLPL